MTDVDANQEQQQETYLVFRLADRLYAFPAECVEYVKSPSTLLRVPTTPPWCPGVVFVRGDILAVIDLTVVFGLSFGSDPPVEGVLNNPVFGASQCTKEPLDTHPRTNNFAQKKWRYATQRSCQITHPMIPPQRGRIRPPRRKSTKNWLRDSGRA